MATGAEELRTPPLGLYVHLPWCVRKCPYCDFNSHPLRGEVPADAYVEALLEDLETDLPLVWGRSVGSIFFGGGTPSLFSADALGILLQGIRARLPLAPDCEITLEANPGTIEHDSFSAYREAGINRVSLGVQTFDDGLLRAIGRIHNAAETENALQSLHASGIDNFNIDIMFGLPGQAVEQAINDVEHAIASGATHISHYQLTLEPNTAFSANPPELPVDDNCWQMQDAARDRLQAAGFGQYEISAWARPGMQCRHNLNYWRYGDYLGIGAGAHAKLTLPASGEIRRLSRQRHPKAYLDGRRLAEDRVVEGRERVFEYFLNQFRLSEAIDPDTFRARTGQAWKPVSERLDEAVAKGLLELRDDRYFKTELGSRFVNDLQAMFLP